MHEPRPTRAGKRRTQTPVFNVPIGVHGEMRWQVYDGDGSPTLADVRSRDGHTRRVHEMAPRRNMILNGGLDDWCGLSDGSSSLRSSSGNRDVLYVGTGSTAPDPDDTELDAVAQEGTTAGTNANDSWQNINGGTVRRYSITVSRRLTMTADRNLTEYAMGRSAAANPLIRELFRDESNDPITISLLNGKIIQVDHTLHIELPRSGLILPLDVENRDVANDLIDTDQFDVEVGMIDSSSTTSTTFSGAGRCASPGNTASSGSTVAYRFHTEPTLPVASPSIVSITGADTLTGAPYSRDEYGAGDHHRVRRCSFTDAQFQGLAYAYAVAFGASQSSGSPRAIQGWVFKFDDPNTFTKAEPNNLQIAYRTQLRRV